MVECCDVSIDEQPIFVCACKLCKWQLWYYFVASNISHNVNPMKKTNIYCKISSKIMHDFSDPLDVTKERNIIIVITVQSFLALPAIIKPILSMQFFFFAMVKYISALIEDTKSSIRKIGHKTPQILTKDFIEMIEFHGKTIEWVFMQGNDQQETIHPTFLFSLMKYFNHRQSLVLLSSIQHCFHFVISERKSPQKQRKSTNRSIVQSGTAIRRKFKSL